ncbi:MULTISPECIES: hypothetical protein [unclassified Archaeoglobus]|jgi:hypothetical protein|uniref:hypothetical protein n=1 Tax=unclassified Archaeoglobus TaxID=2643606 RepID=UPI0025B9CFB9|nr:MULTISPECIES: hypothetical protein [unclassified Archaeoglobus]
MFDVRVESEDGVCKIKLYPSNPELEIGGYGRDDIIVFKGAPVSIVALQRMLENEFGNTLIVLRKNSLEVELQRLDCKLVVDDVAKAIEEMMENAAKDLEVIEDAIKDSLQRYIRRMRGGNGD